MADVTFWNFPSEHRQNGEAKLSFRSVAHAVEELLKDFSIVQQLTKKTVNWLSKNKHWKPQTHSWESSFSRTPETQKECHEQEPQQESSGSVTQGHTASCWTHPNSWNCAFACALWPGCLCAVYSSDLFFPLTQLTTIPLIIWQEKLQMAVDELFSFCSQMPQLTSLTTTSV